MSKLLVTKKNGELLLNLDLSGRRCLSIGRSPQSDLVLNATSISRHHALLIAHEGRWQLLDIHSRTGLWDSSGSSRRIALKPRQWVRIGPAYLWLDQPESMGKQSDGVPASGSWKRKPGQGLHLVVAESGQSHLRSMALENTEIVTIGSSEACNLKIIDPVISPLHCVVFREQGQWCVVGADFNAEIISGAKRIHRLELEKGHTFRIGETCLWLGNDISDCKQELYDVSSLAPEVVEFPLRLAA